MDSRKRAVISLAFLVCVIPAVYLIWVLLLTNPAAQGTPPPDLSSALVPGTDAPVRQKFTGVAAIDQQLTVLFYFFWDVANGGTPGLSLYMTIFFGDIFVMYGLLMLEGLRPGNIGRMVSYTTVVGLIFQNFVYACTMPIFFAIYFCTSPLVSSSRKAAVLPDAVSTVCILPALALGLVAPSILAALPVPTVVSYDLKQLLMAVWQPFPLWVGLTHWALQSLVPQLLPLRTMQRLRANPQATLRVTYAVLLGFSLMVRFSALGISIAATLFPALFNPAFVDQLALPKVLLPATALHTAPVPSIAEASLLLLQWDMTIGSGAVLAWAAILLATTNRAAANPISGITLFALIPAGMMILGSGGCAMALLWTRDESLFVRDDEKKRA